MRGIINKPSVLSTLLLLIPSATLATQLTEASSDATGFPPCDALRSAGLGERILLPTSDAYEDTVQSWWSASARLRPWCFFQPQKTEEVAGAIRALASSGNGAGDWHIAVRSGGHSYPRSNNIEDGVTIDLENMNGSWYDPDRQLVSIEPGGRWKDVYENLLKTANMTATGGRDGDVGVGGFLLGGGNSYYSGSNGFGCDTVVNFEVVLANGTIVEANGVENPDLYKALKGGGMNFGIVTRFDLQAIPAVDIAYGETIMATNYSNDVIDAVVDFTDRAELQRHDHLFAAYTYSAESGSDAILSVRVNTMGDLNTTSFNRLNKIPTLQSTWETMSLAAAANASQLPAGLRNVGTTLTFRNSPSVLRHNAVLHSQLVSTLSEKIGAENFIAFTFIQPLPSYYGRIGHSKGGNVLGLDRIGSNAILWTCGVGILSDDAALAIAEVEVAAMTIKLKEFAISDGAGADFVYLNYAGPNQDPLGSYGPENVAFMRGVAQQYDPEGWWQSRVPGGFKLSRVVSDS